MDEKTIARFWSKVDKRGPDECWPWTARRDRDGYGIFTVHHGTTAKAHRFAFFLQYGQWPTPCGLHKCDNPPCCNWAHVRAGTVADNHVDMISRGRGRYPGNRLPGESHGNAKLTDDAVRFIRAHRGIIKGVQLARMFDVSSPLIAFIQMRKGWTHIP